MRLFLAFSIVMITSTQVWADSSVVPPQPESDYCLGSVPCMGGYLTLVEFFKLGGYPTMRSALPDILAATMAAEYWVAVYPGKNITQTIPAEYPGLSVREIGREAIARNLYQACGVELDATNCTWDGLYRFLSAWQPWLAVNSDPKTGKWFVEPTYALYAAKTMRKRAGALRYYRDVYTDVNILMDYQKSAELGYIYGADFNRPWQFWNQAYSLPKSTLGFSANQQAVLQVEINGNPPAYKYFIIKTYSQTVKNVP